MIDEAGPRDRVTQACRLEYLFTLDEELQVTVHRVCQVEVVLKPVLAHDDLLAWLARMVKAVRHVTHLEVCQVTHAIFRRVHTILGNCEARLEESVASIVPLGPVIAHEEGAVWVQVHTRNVQTEFLLLLEEGL